ncbi:MAG TPA: hypothetical protein H9937_04085 [Candidatus Alistipes stercorigallinarum]|nr:hypothetical protein [Candidatus Alistipes stercorigallinarum]
MRKQIFKAICDRLAEKVPEVAFIDLWNDNVNTLNGGTAFPFPAVFVEFETIEWRQQGNSARMGDIAVRLHIVTRAMTTNGSKDSRMEEALAYFDIIDRINAAMQRLSGENFASFMLTTSATNHNHAELIESVERYVTRAQDITAMPSNITTAKLDKAVIRVGQ